MSATASAPLIRAGPGVSAETALPERDRALLLWLVQGAALSIVVCRRLRVSHELSRFVLLVWDAVGRRATNCQTRCPRY